MFDSKLPLADAATDIFSTDSVPVELPLTDSGSPPFIETAHHCLHQSPTWNVSLQNDRQL